MIHEQDTMTCAQCGERDTTVHINSNGEEMVIILDTGWCYQLMTIGTRLRLLMYCPTCAIREVNIEPMQIPRPIVTVSAEEWGIPQCNCERSHPKEEHDETCPAKIEHTLQHHQCDKCNFDECTCPLCNERKSQLYLNKIKATIPPGQASPL